MIEAREQLAKLLEIFLRLYKNIGVPQRLFYDRMKESNNKKANYLACPFLK